MHIYWSPEFPDKKEKLLHKIKEIVKKEYYDRRNTLHEDLFIVWKWILNTETNETYDRVSWEIWEKYDSHWITKSTQLPNLLNLLDNWIDESRAFSTAPFELTNETKHKISSAIWTWWGTSYKDWIWIITSNYNKTIKEDWIKFVFINDIYWDLISPLSELYPQFNFYLLSEQKEVLEWATQEKENIDTKKVPNYFYEWTNYFDSVFLNSWDKKNISDYEKILKQYDNKDIESLINEYNIANENSIKYNFTNPDIAWKIHLNVSPNNVIKISEYLISNWYFHKYISWWDINNWKIFTIYIWSHSLAKNISKKISNDNLKYLLKPNAKNEIELAAWIVWRFVNLDKKDFNQYWTCWFSLLKWWIYKKGKAFDTHVLRSFNTLSSKFWKYFYDNNK